jgi:hypothetical protein
MGQRTYYVLTCDMLSGPERMNIRSFVKRYHLVAAEQATIKSHAAIMVSVATSVLVAMHQALEKKSDEHDT